MKGCNNAAIPEYPASSIKFWRTRVRKELHQSNVNLSRSARAFLAGFAALVFMSCAENASSAETQDNAATGAKHHAVTIVVLGSSSPAGKNIYKLFNRPKAEEREYAEKYNWVTLYGEHLKTLDPENSVVNLAAASGHSTSIALNEKKGGALYKSSLAYALKTYPHADAMIVNFPAIRGQEGEDVAGVVANLEEIEKRALAAGVGKVWIATAQPSPNKAECFKSRSGACDAGLTIYQSRIDLTDAIVAAFPGRHLDFYSPLAKGKNRAGVADPKLLNPIDKLHPNLKGHEALRDAVIAAGVYEDAAGR